MSVAMPNLRIVARGACTEAQPDAPHTLMPLM
jgi:hypothetical protein